MAGEDELDEAAEPGPRGSPGESDRHQNDREPAWNALDTVPSCRVVDRWSSRAPAWKAGRSREAVMRD
jgi:hypothetical protein